MSSQRSNAEKPDSGWSWVVAFSCFLINGILFGINRLAGILLVATRDEFGGTRQHAALPYTLGMVMRNLCTPLVGLAGQKFGVRGVTLFGGACTAICVSMCSLAKGVTWIAIFWGLGFGTGFGFGNTLLPVSINLYFDKHRASASGISFAGACVGSFLLPPLIKFLIGEFGLKGTFLFLSGILLHIIPFSMLLRKPPYIIEKKAEPTPPHVATSNSDSVKVVECLKSPNTPIPVASVRNDDFQTDKKSGIQNISLNSLSDSDQCTNVNQTSTASENVLPDVITDSHDHFDKPNSTRRQCMRLCCSPMFILICLSSAVFSYTFTCMVTCVIDFATDVGIEDNMTQYMLMSFSVGDMIGRLGLGWITDRGYMSKTNFTGIFFLLQGIASASVSWSTGFWSLMSTILIYGIFEAGSILIFPLLVAEYVDADLQILAVPSSNVLCSPLGTLVPVVIGFFRERLGSYSGVFYQACAMSCTCAAIWLLLPFIEKKKNKRKIQP